MGADRTPFGLPRIRRAELTNRLLAAGVGLVLAGAFSSPVFAAAPTEHSAAAKAAALITAPAGLVNPFIGTSNQGDDLPGADVPFGLVQWSPDTPSIPGGGGYEYNDSSITG